jgi:type II secretory pathway component PulM
MRILLVALLMACLALTGCEFFTPDTSRAISQTKQMEELHKQTEQLQRQADALERLADAVDQAQP